jgi:potassium-transporting ATPase KdpC subunit
MLGTLRAAFVGTLGLMALTGLAYPLAVTGVCQALLPHAANGSLALSPDGKVIGSERIGQVFASPKYFWGRPSAAGTGYDPQASSPSNLAPTSKKLADSFKAEADKARADGVTGPISADRLTGSGSGLDPDISVENALGQIARVAKSRGISAEKIREVLLSNVEGRTLGLFGEPRVNVLALNRALDDIEK